MLNQAYLTNSLTTSIEKNTLKEYNIVNSICRKLKISDDKFPKINDTKKKIINENDNIFTFNSKGDTDISLRRSHGKKNITSSKIKII